MIGLTDLSEVMDYLYEAVQNSDGWTTALQALSEYLGASAATLLVIQLSTSSLLHMFGVGYRSNVLQAYRERYYSDDPRWLAVLKNTPRHVLVSRLSAYGRHNGPFCEWLCKNGGQDHFVGVNFPASPDVAAILLAEFRREPMPQDDPPATERLRTLLPCVAVAVQASLFVPAAGVAEALLAHLHLPVFVLDDRGRVLHVNRRGVQLLGGGDLAIEQGRLTSAVAAARMRLDALSNGLVRTRDAERMPCMLLLPRSQGRHPYVLRLFAPAPLPPPSPRVIPTIWIVTVTDTESLPLPSVLELRQLFELTPRQAQLALLLARGQTLAQAAKCMSVSEKTARGHLELLLRKTNTRRQGELISLVSACSPSIML